jgi:hypothetical protein
MKSMEEVHERSVGRRDLLRLAALLPAVTIAGAQTRAAHGEPGSPTKASLRNAILLGDRFVLWQSSYGSTDLVKCPYRTPGQFNAYNLHPCGPATRALYRLYRYTGVEDYKAAADRYATYLMNCIYDPIKPYRNTTMLNGKERTLLSSAWMYGKALSPCYECFSVSNPNEDAYELKAYAIYRWLQEHRRSDSYYGVGYPWSHTVKQDAQFSCDLGELGDGLMGFYDVSHHKPALDDAIGLAQFFLTEYQEGSGRGVWSSKLGVWLVGPWPGSGAEHFQGQKFNETGWGWSAYICAHYLLRLRPHVDAKTRADIEDKCVKAMQWCYDACQFEDGALGMFGRDDKWVGMNAAAILLYLDLHEVKLVPADIDARYRPKVDRAWRWMLDNTGRDTMPPDGYIRVSGTTSKKPLENVFWLMTWTMEALLEGGKAFES